MPSDPSGQCQSLLSLTPSSVYVPGNCLIAGDPVLSDAPEPTEAGARMAPLVVAAWVLMVVLSIVSVSCCPFLAHEV
jgi:hypothetical protein